jgi:membrane dipeptidase
MSKVLDHIDHIIRVGGIDCVGLGSDFDGMNPPPIGLEDISKMPKITDGLIERGYSVEEIRKIVGGNFLRLFGQVCGEGVTKPIL